MTAASWDDLAAQRALDAEDMAGAIARMPEVVKEAFAAGQAVGRPLAAPRAVVVVAMGGSAIGADLLRGLAGPLAPWPILVHRGPGLPPWVGPQDLVVLASHSGTTAETLEAFRQAHARQLPLLVVSSGGPLGQAAEADGLPWLRLPPGGAPRAALGWGLFGLSGALLGQAEGWPARLEAVEAALRRRALACGLAAPLATNPAKQLAQALLGQAVGVVAGGPDTEALARRWACQLHENAKVLAWFAALPEWSHNEVVAWARAPRPTTGWSGWRGPPTAPWPGPSARPPLNCWAQGMARWSRPNSPVRRSPGRRPWTWSPWGIGPACTWPTPRASTPPRSPPSSRSRPSSRPASEPDTARPRRRV